jgi:hypothetical protein
MSEIRNPDGTVAVPKPEKVRRGRQLVFFYKADVPDNFVPKSVSYFEEEGDSAMTLADGTFSFELTHPQPTTIRVAKTWDFYTEYDIAVKVTEKTAPWLFREPTPEKIGLVETE